MSQIASTSAKSPPRVFPASCEACRKRKSRCNRLKPCSNCEIRGIADQCYLIEPQTQGRKVVYPRSNSNGSQSSARNSVSDSSKRRSRSPPSMSILQSPRSSTNINNTEISPQTHHDISPYNTSEATLATSRTTDSGSVEKPADRVLLEEASEHLPSASLCSKFLLYFFDELMPKVSFVNKDAFFDVSESFFKGRKSLSKREASLLFWIMAYASLTAPPRHALRSTFIDLKRSAHQWKQTAVSYHSIDANAESISYDEFLLDIGLCAMEAMWGSTLKADHERNWQLSGIGIRKASALHLFSSNKPSWGRKVQMRPDSERSDLISIPHMIQKLLVMDRWIAFIDLRPLGIHPSDITLPLAKLELGGNLRAGMEQEQIKLLEKAREIALMPPSNHHEVAAFLQHIDEVCSKAISFYRQDTPVKLDAAQCTQGESGKHAAVLLSWLASSLFIGCCTAMRFSSEQNAPQYLRIAGLKWAQNLLALAPSINAIQADGRYAIRLTRIANHMFYAIRVIFLTLSGSDIDREIAETNMQDPMMFGSCTWIESVGNNSIPDATHNDLDLNRIQEHFRSCLQLFESFSNVGCTSATQALRLIEKVLKSSANLRRRLNWTSNGYGSNEVMTLNGFESTAEMDAAATLNLLQDYNNSRIPTSMEPAQLATDLFLDPSVWQMPELSDEDFESLLATWA